jgi:tyrosine-specific transport protein
MKKKNFGHVLGAALLITGTSVGAGMLGLPVITAFSGFFPAFIVFLLCWGIMTVSGLLYLELCLQMPTNTNIISMSERYLGKKGKIFAWITYLFLFYCLSVAYISGGGSFIRSITGSVLPSFTAIIFFVIVFSSFVYLGAKIVDRVNLFLMTGLIVSYLLFVFFGIKYIQLDFLSVANWNGAFYSLPIIIISFGYQGIIPSLTTYLNKDLKKLRTAIILGTSFSLIIYLVWEALILGIIPLEGTHGLIMTKIRGENAIIPLSYVTREGSIYAIGQFFSFFAITTSFLGVTLGLFDFLSDGLRLPKKGAKKVVLAAFTFLPPFFIAIVNPNIFLTALNYAGGIGGVLILIFLPTLMVWFSRYKIKNDFSYQVKGGRSLLLFLFFFVICELIIEFHQEYIRIIG